MPIIDFICSFCSKSFKDYQFKNRVFCSKKCEYQGKKARSTVKKQCKLCKQYFTKKRGEKKIFCSRACATKIKRKNGITSHGYEITWNGTNKRQYFHRKKAEQILGKTIDSKHRIHHIDGDTLNNQNNNLVICENQSYHRLLHKRTKSFYATGNPNLSYCAKCNKWKDHLSFSAKNGYGSCKPCRRKVKTDYPVNQFCSQYQDQP